MGIHQNPLVSIGVPTYNRPITLDRTLNCLVNQTYTNLEIIVSDNCSTICDVEQIINKYSLDPRIKYFKQPVNQGAIFNINFVLKKATGDYFMRLNDDDWIDLNYIESCLYFLLDKPEFSSAYGPAMINNIRNEITKEDILVNMEQSLGTERVKHYLKNTVYNAPFYGLMRRYNYQLLPVTNKLADDWLIISRIAFLGKFKMMENTHCYISQGGISQSFESTVQNLKLPKYVKYFPYFEVGKNLFVDILWGSDAFKSLSFFQRFKFGIQCYKIIWKRYSIKSELKRGFLALLKKGYFFFSFKGR